MKNKFIILPILIALFFESCTDKFEEYNTDTKNPAIVSAESLFSNGQLTLVDQVSSTNVNLNVWKLFAQYWTETTYTDEANYDVVTRTIPDNTFQAYYRGFLRDFQEAESIINWPTNTDAPGVKANKLAIIELHNVYAYQNLVDIFGNIPYGEALDIENYSPVYEDGFTIYKDLITRVDAALASLDPASPSFGSADLIFGGDVIQWRKFANSLKLKLGVAIADHDVALSKATVEAAVTDGVLMSSDDNAILVYLGATHTNPIYQDVVQSGRDDFVPANTVVDLMNTLADPRRPYYFTTVDTSSTDVEKLAYVGGIYGESNPFSQYSHIADQIILPDFPGIVITYDEVLFYMAEAAARGFTVGSTAAGLYNQAVTESVLWWGGTPAEAAAYLAQPSVTFSLPAWREKIGTQAYIAFYTRGLEGYTQWRRLDYPILNVPPAISSDPVAPTDYLDIPKRFTYPINEQTLNKTNYDQASTAIGGDNLTTKIFWDKF